MRKPACILGFMILASAAMAYPMSDVPEPLLDNPDQLSLNHEWLTSTSFLFNQLKSISQTPLVPAVPPATPDKSLAEAPSAPFGFQYDLNLDGKLDEFLPLPLPPLLCTSYSPDRGDASRISTKLFALTLPSLNTAPGDGAPSWIEAICLSQNTYVVDVSAMARGQAGLTGKAQWSAGKSGPSTPSPSTPKWARVPAVSISWLALLFGGCLILWQRQWSRREFSS